jgi:hypothetical protein
MAIDYQKIRQDQKNFVNNLILAKVFILLLA